MGCSSSSSTPSGGPESSANNRSTLRPVPPPPKDRRSAEKTVGPRLYEAAETGNINALRSLTAEWRGHTILNYTNTGDHLRTPLMAACAKGKAEAARLLLSTPGVAVNKACELGSTALILAAEGGHADCIRALLGSSRLDVNRTDMEGLTALMVAVRAVQPEVVSVLLSSTVINTLTFVANPSFDMNASTNGNASGASTEPNKPITETAPVPPTLNINQCDLKGRSALVWAVIIGSAQVVQLLLSVRGTDVNVRVCGGSFSGKTALAIAQEKGEGGVVLSSLLRGAGARL